MQLNYETILWTLSISIPIAIILSTISFRAEKRKQKEANRLWETGATRLLAQVWGLSNDRQPDELPVIGEHSHVTRAKILKHIWRSDQKDKSFEYEVCGEKVSLLLKYPNTLFGFVEKQETLDAIQEAHDAMSDPDQQLYVGIIPLVLDIRVTDPDV